MNTHVTQRTNAMNKSRQILFCKLCKFLDLEEDKMQIRWEEMDQEEKSVLVKGFVDEWGANFHPLSAMSVEELIQEHIQEKKKMNKKKTVAEKLLKRGRRLVRRDRVRDILVI
ncbi:hypothetical protein LINPERPRIM_LOCUS32794 [Linum perenne]